MMELGMSRKEKLDGMGSACSVACDLSLADLFG